MKKDVYQNPYKYAYRPESTMATLPVIPPTENKGNIESCPDVFYSLLESIPEIHD